MSEHGRPGEASLGVRLVGTTLESLRAAFGGRVANSNTARTPLGFLRPPHVAGRGDLTLLAANRHVGDAQAAIARGAALLVSEELAGAAGAHAAVWVHAFAPWAFAKVLETHTAVPDEPARLGDGCEVHPTAVLHPRVVLGRRVRVEAHAVVGRAGFGWAPTPEGGVIAIPQLGGVVVDDEVSIGPLCTVDAGTLEPTRIHRGVKLDAHVHVGHNVEIGEGTIVAAQAGFAGSVVIGRGVLVGGQAGIADHVRVGDGARIAAKSGVIGDVAAGTTVAGYPAVERHRWLRAWGFLHRAAAKDQWGRRSST